MEGYVLYRKEGKTALVLSCDDDDELFYLLSKLERTRVKWLKAFAKELIVDFFQKISGEDSEPQVKTVSTRNRNN
jgi:hypothetical protein